MMEMTIFEKLQTILSDNILNFISELENLETSDKSVLSENVQKFINLYSSSDKVINIELLHTFFEYLDTKKISSLDYYEQLFSYLDYCKRNNYNNMYNYDIKKCNSEFDKLIAEVNQLNNNLLKDIREIGFKKRVLRENIDLYRKLISVCSLYENDKFLSKASFELLCDFLIDNSSILEQEEVFSLIHSIVKSNVEKMSNRIKIETLKKHKSKQKKEKILQQKLEQEKMEILNDEPITPVEPVPVHIEEELEKPTENLSDYQLQLIKDAKVISDDVYGVSSSVNVALSMLNQDLSIEERLMIYQTLSVNYDRKSVISIDLKSNVLPVLNDSISNGKNCDRLFDDLKKIVDFYNELLIQKEEITVDFTTCLEKLGMSEELEKCYSADNLLETCLQYRDENQQEFYLTELPTLIEKLISKKDEFEQCVLEFYHQHGKEDKELMDLLYSEFLESLKNLDDCYSTVLSTSTQSKEKLLELSKEFYESNLPIKNIILFVNDDDSICPIIEEDIKNEHGFNAKTYDLVLRKLKECVNDDFVATGNHKVKNQKYYSEEFVKKYKVKSINNGVSRIFYSRFNSTLGELFNCGNLHVVFIYLVGYGKTDSRSKVDINYEALKRCHDDKENIDFYCDLLNTNWESLPEKEKLEKQKLVFDYLTRQSIKLGHFISSVNEKNKNLGEGGKQNG